MIECTISLDRQTSCGLRQKGSFTNSGSSDLVLILGCMTSNLPKYLSFSTLYSSSLRRTHTIIFSKLNKPPSLLSPLSNGLEIPQILMAPQSHQLNEHFFHSIVGGSLMFFFFFFWQKAKTRNLNNVNRLLMTKFGRILCLVRKWRQKCSVLTG